MKELNLFESYLKTPAKGTGAARKFGVLTIVFLVFYSLVAAGIFSYWLVLKQQESSLAKKIDFQEQKVQELREVESLQVLVKQRLAALSGFLAEKAPDYQQIITDLESLLPPEVRFTSIEMSLEKGFVFSGEASSAVSLAEFIKRVMGSEKIEPFESVVLSSMSRAKDGSYKFTFDFNARN